MEQAYKELIVRISDTCVGYEITDVALASMSIMHLAIERIEEVELQKCLALTIIGLLQDFR